MTGAKAQQSISRYRWIVLLASIFAFIIYGFALQSVPPLLKEFQTIFGVDAATAGLLMSMVVIPGIVMALPAAVLIDRYSFRKIGFFSIFAVAVGSLIMALSSNFPVVLLARVLIGFGGGLLSVGTPSIVPQWFQHKEMGRAMAVYAVGIPIATTAAFFSAPILSQSFGWQSPFYLTSFVSMFSAIFFWLIVKDGPLKVNSKAVMLSDVRETLSNREIWKVSLVWMFFNIVAIGFLTWAPYLFTLFKEATPVYASILSSLIMITNFFFVPLFGFASDKVGKRKPFIIAGMIFMAISLNAVAFASGFSLVICIIILGAAAGGVPSMVMAITAQTLPPKSAGMGFGVIAFWQNIGIATTAPIVGYIIGITNSLSLTFLGLSIFALIGALIALTLRSR